MANSPVVTSLPAYTDQNSDLLISNSVLGAKSAKLFSLLTGVKYKKALNVLSNTITFGDGGSCGWTEAGAATLSQRVLTAGAIKVNMAYCHASLLQKYANHEVEITAGREKLPFEEEFVNSVIEGIQEEVEKVIWNGDTSSSDNNLKRFDGLIKIINEETDSIKSTITSGKSYNEAVKQVLAAMPDGVVDKDDAVIFCSPSFRRAYMQELVDANLYHFVPGEDLDDFKVPGSNVRLIVAPGIGSSKKLVAGRLSNFFYGCDLEGGDEQFDFFWAKENQEFRLAVKFIAGVQIAFPAEVVLGTYTTLTSPSSVSVNIAALADANHVYKTDEQE